MKKINEKEAAKRMIDGEVLLEHGTPWRYHDGSFEYKCAGKWIGCALPYNADWKESPSVERPTEPPEEPSIIGVKFLTKDGCSPWAGRRREGSNWGAKEGAKSIKYPVGEWIKVRLNGCYLAVDGGIGRYGSLLAADPAGAPFTELVINYFEGRELLATDSGYRLFVPGRGSFLQKY